MKSRSYLGEKKTHYKMYKKGKSWVTMGVTLLSVGLGLELGTTVNADNVSSISTSNSSNSSSIESKSSNSLQKSDTVKLKSSSVTSASSSKDSKNQSSVKKSITSSSSCSYVNIWHKNS